MEFISRIIGNMAGVWIAASLVSQVVIERSDNGWITLLNVFLIAVVLTIINMTLRPLVKALTFPLYILTLGLFSVITNGLMFYLTGWLASKVELPLVVDGWWPAVFAGTITAIIASIVAGVLGSAFSKSPSSSSR